MAYSDFTLSSALQELAPRLHDRDDLSRAVAPVDEGELLPAILADGIPLATAIHAEKARSEMIVVPILLEAWRRTGRRASLLSRSPSQFVLGPPVIAVVEAQDDSIQGGLGQCVAEMVAAQVFNARQADVPPADLPEAIHGVATTGSSWRFLRLRGDQLEIDRVEYMLGSVGKILAIVVDCLTGSAPGTPASEAAGP